MQYFRVLDDNVAFPDRWFLDEPITESGQEIDAREFRYGRPYIGPRPHEVPIQQPGKRVQFHLAAFDMPVLSENAARLVVQIALGEVECFPVTVGSSITGYEIVNAICREGCVDEERSVVTRWTAAG